MIDEIVVSVIITTYNRWNFVQQAIDSVLAQTYPNYELIVIDDGSTDGTKELLPSKYKGKLKYVWHENQERSKARNLGISLSKGKYLAFLDSDDKWHPDKLIEQVEYIEKRREKEPSIALVCSSVWLIDSEGKLITNKIAGRKTNLEKLKPFDFLIGSRIYAPPSNALYVREYVEKVGGFDKDLPPIEDRGLLIKLREKYKFVYLDKPLIYYRVHKENTPGLSTHEKIEDRLSVLLKLIDKLCRSKWTSEEIASATANFYEEAAYWHFNIHDWENGRENLIQAWESNPAYFAKTKRFVNKIAINGYKSSIKHIKTNLADELMKYFEDFYFPNIKKVWPNSNLEKIDVKRKIEATYSHILVTDKNAIISKKEAIDLCLKAFSYSRYLISIETWKTLIKHILS